MAIEANDFIAPAKALGFSTWAGVPCSFLTPFINRVIDDADMSYISSANEGDAVATATGAALAGQRAVAMMQNSGLGNAVNPLSSLNWVFRIPILLIITLRGEPGLQDEPQHELMGRITGPILDELQIPSDWFPRQADEVEGALMVANWQMERSGLPYALVMRKGSIEPAPLETRWAPQARPAAFPDRVFRTDEAELTRQGVPYVKYGGFKRCWWKTRQWTKALSLAPRATPAGGCLPSMTGQINFTWLDPWDVPPPWAWVSRWPCQKSASWLRTGTVPP